MTGCGADEPKLKQNGKLEMVWFCVCGFEGIVWLIFGSLVKRLRHRPFTAVTRVRFP